MKLKDLLEDDAEALGGGTVLTRKIPVKRLKMKRRPIKPKDAPLDKKKDD